MKKVKRTQEATSIKEYESPSCRLIQLDNTGLICTSNEMVDEYEEEW